MESKKNRIRTSLIRKQQAIFLIMLATGIGLLLASPLSGRYLVAEGIAFMLVGVAGLLMSWTTFDIGAGIKEVVREVGRENREAMDSLAASQKEIAASQKEIAVSQKEMAASMDRMADSQKETQMMIAASMDKISESQDNIARLLERAVKDTGTGARHPDNRDLAGRPSGKIQSARR